MQQVTRASLRSIHGTILIIIPITVYPVVFLILFNKSRQAQSACLYVSWSTSQEAFRDLALSECFTLFAVNKNSVIFCPNTMRILGSVQRKNIIFKSNYNVNYLNILLIIC